MRTLLSITQKELAASSLKCTHTRGSWMGSNKRTRLRRAAPPIQDAAPPVRTPQSPVCLDHRKCHPMMPEQPQTTSECRTPCSVAKPPPSRLAQDVLRFVTPCPHVNDCNTPFIEQQTCAYWAERHQNHAQALPQISAWWRSTAAQRCFAILFHTFLSQYMLLSQATEGSSPSVSTYAGKQWPREQP
jgi:hypothetical protein